MRLISPAAIRRVGRGHKAGKKMANEELRGRRAHTESKWRDAEGTRSQEDTKGKMWRAVMVGVCQGRKCQPLKSEGCCSKASTTPLSTWAWQMAKPLWACFPSCIMEIITMSTSEGDCED